MKSKHKTAQLQIRVSPQEKEAIRLAAHREDSDISSYVLRRLFTPRCEEFRCLVEGLSETADGSYAYAAINDFLSSLGRDEFSLVVAQVPSIQLNEDDWNYLAAMVEHAAHQKQLSAPAWTKNIAPVLMPVFATQLVNLRLALLLNAPPAFRRRNIFVDASIGDRV
ncbi:hypothetical protein MNBD_GAMMA26-1441 [hydrothermal vent metagenome]|uniref:DUF1778 domain-containing protein n=1 Tax=hydrothermal vent metagenome TaxID=652676 RepID=A0A3B1BLN3_9ZZZZ